MNQILRDYETLQEKLHQIEKAYQAFEKDGINEASTDAFCYQMYKILNRENQEK